MYKVGDEVLIKAEITDVHEGCENAYFVAPKFGSYNWVSEDKIILANKTYTQGLVDAWELAKRLFAFELDEREKMLGYQSMKAILEDLTPEYVMDRIEAYENEKEIKVGDVVKAHRDGFNAVVMRIEDGIAYVMYDDFSGGEYRVETLIKTGKNIDITGLLRQIGE